MYLMDSTATAVNNRKWNLGRLGNGVRNMPVVPGGAQNPSPVTGSASNGGITTVMATRPSTNPLDYTSPQAAIAAGLDPPTVYTKWMAALAKFPSPQAAISAGVPAGVVNQLWQQSYQNAANKKANLGRMGRMGLQPVRLPNLGRMGASGTGQPWRMRGMRGLRFFGDDTIDTTSIPSDTGLTPPIISPIDLPANAGTVWAAQNPQVPVNTTSVPSTAPLQAPATSLISLITGAKAGAPVYYNPATGAVSTTPPPPAAASGTIFGLSPTTLLAAGVGIFALSALGGGGGRRR